MLHPPARGPTGDGTTVHARAVSEDVRGVPVSPPGLFRSLCLLHAITSRRCQAKPTAREPPISNVQKPTHSPTCCNSIDHFIIIKVKSDYVQRDIVNGKVGFRLRFFVFCLFLFCKDDECFCLGHIACFSSVGVSSASAQASRQL